MPCNRATRLTRTLAALILTLALLTPGPAPAQDDKKQQGPPPSPVKVAPLEERVVSTQVTLVGTTEPFRQTTVAAEVDGAVIRFPVTEGDYVTEGAELAAMRDNELKLRLTALEAVREQAEARLKLSAIELERYAKLKETKSVATTEYDKIFYEHKALRSQLLKAEADIAQLAYDIDRTRVKAPFDGFVVAEHTQVGEWLKVGSPVVSLVDLTLVKVSVSVPERYAVKLKTEDPVTVALASLPGERLTGKITAVLAQGNPEARTFPVTVLLDNPDHRIKAGMEASVTLSLADTFTALLAPKDAVVTSGAGRMVYLVIEGKAVPAPVEVQGYYDGSVAVQGNLKPGAQVVVRGNERLRPGQPVQVIE